MTAQPARSYGLSPSFVLRWLLSASFRTSRQLGRDAEQLLVRHTPDLRAAGVEHVPPDGPFILIMNHYERTGLRVWWPALWVSALLWQMRREDPPVRWLISSAFYRYRVGPLRVPDRVFPWLLSTIGARYGQIVVPRRESARSERSAALREAEASLRATGRSARPVGITPEAAHSHGPALTRPSRNAGIALAYLSRGEIPLLPAAAYEDGDGRLTVRFGPTFTLPWQGWRDARAVDPPLVDVAMGHLAALVPESLRGAYVDEAPTASDGRRA